MWIIPGGSASLIDGANRLQRIRCIVELPALKPIITIQLII